MYIHKESYNYIHGTHSIKVSCSEVIMTIVKRRLWEGPVQSCRAPLKSVLCPNIDAHYGAIWLSGVCGRSRLSCWTQTSVQCWNALHRKAVGNISTWYSRDRVHRRNKEEQVWVKLLNLEFATLKVEQHQNYNIINYIINVNIYPERYYLIFQSSIFKAFWQLKYTRFPQFWFTFLQKLDDAASTITGMHKPGQDLRLPSATAFSQRWFILNTARDFLPFEQIFWQSPSQYSLLWQHEPGYKCFF